MYQYFKRQLKTPTCFGSCGIHPQGVLKRASLKLLVELSSEIVSPDTHTTGPNLKLPNTDYAHKTSQVISVKHVLILPEDGTHRIRNMSEFLIVF